MARNRIHDYLEDKRAEKAEQLLPYDLGDLLIGALLKELSEPLDLLDMEESEKARVRESF